MERSLKKPWEITLRLTYGTFSKKPWVITLRSTYGMFLKNHGK